MDRERLARARKAMAEAGLDALVLRLPENVLMLSGDRPLVGKSFLLFPLEGEPLIVIPRSEEREARDELWPVRLASYLDGVLGADDPYLAVGSALRGAPALKRARRIGYEGSFESMAAPWNAAEPSVQASPSRDMLESVFRSGALVDATELLYGLRSRKTPLEQGRLRRANEIAAMGLAVFLSKAEAGVSGLELVSAVESAILVHGTGHGGARRVRAFAQVSTGPAETALAYRPMVISTGRCLEAGDLAVLELGVVADGFWADRTRTRVAGKLSERQRSAAAAVRDAQRAAIAAVCPGAIAGDVDSAARGVIRSAGLEREFLHVTGHGLGFRYHEPVPLIAPGATTRLEEGMVHSVEPGVYLEGMGGIRLEENVLVTASGSEVMGPCGDDLEKESS